MNKLIYLILGLVLGVPFFASALSTYLTVQGGTGTTTPSGILYGDNGSTNHLNTVTIGNNLTFSGGTLSATGGGAGNWFTPTTYGISASNATSTLTGFLNGLYTTASSTIGDGSAGLTISGSATTTGNAYIAGNVGIGTSSPVKPLEVTSGAGNISTLRLSSSNASYYTDLINSVDANNAFRIQQHGQDILHTTGDGSAAITVGNSNGKLVLSPANSVSYFPNGNVGIGTTTPVSVLQITKAVSTTSLGQFDASLKVQNVTASANSGSEVSFMGRTDSGAGKYAATYAAISAPVIGEGATGSNGYLNFSTKVLATDTTLTERMRITGAGLIAIGTTSPLARLDVAGVNSGTGPVFQVSTVAAFATSTQLIVTSTGNVGVGTSSPSSKLHVEGTNGVTGGLTIASNTGTATNRLAIYGSGNTSVVFQKLNVNTVLGFLNSAGGEEARFDTAGNFGLGTTSPYLKLSVEGASALGNSALAGYFIATSTTASTFAGGFLASASSTINGNATTTGTQFAGIASSTQLFGANLTTCNAGNVLTWSGGLFGCVADQTAAGAANPFTWASTYATLSAATTSPVWFQGTSASFFASSTAYFGSGGVGSSTLALGNTPVQWTVGELGTDNSFRIASGTELTAFPALTIDKNLKTTVIHFAATDATSSALSVTASSTIGGVLNAVGGIVTNAPSALLVTNSGGLVSAYGGAAACTNQFVTALSATGGTTCASIAGTSFANQSANTVFGNPTGVSAAPQFFATSTLFAGLVGQNAFFNGTGILVGTSTIFTSTASFVGIGTTTPWAKFSVDTTSVGVTQTAFTVGSALTTNFVINGNGQIGFASSSPSSLWGMTVATSTVFTTQFGGFIASSTSAATYTVNWETGNTQRFILNQNSTFIINATSSNPRDGFAYKLKLCQDGTGSRTVTFATPGQLNWSFATTVISTAANTANWIGMVYDARTQRYDILASTTNMSNASCLP